MRKSGESRGEPVGEREQRDERREQHADARQDQAAGCRGTDAAAARGAADRAARERRGVIDVTVAGMRLATAYGMNVNFACPSAEPRPTARRTRCCAAACARGRGRSIRRWLRARGRRQRHPIEVGDPAAHRVLILGRPRVLDAAVHGARHLIAARQVVEADGRGDASREATGRSNQRPTPRRSSTSYEKVVGRPLWIASRTSGVRPSVSSNDTSTWPSRAIGVTGQIRRAVRAATPRPASARRRPRAPRAAAARAMRHSFAFSRSFSSVMNSPMSRKWR